MTAATELPEGTNTITARVRDTAGNEATATSAFIVDVTKPVVAIAQPAAGAYTSAQTVDVTGTITDASPATVTVNGVAAVVTGSMFTAAGLPLGSGPGVSFLVVATDAAGNTGERSVSVTVDRANPVVQIQTPSAGKYFQSGSLVVTGTVADDSTTEVSVNGVPATVGGGTFTATLQTADGRLDLLVIARDAASNIGEAASFVVIDSVAPVLTISAPASGLITNAASVTVTGTASDSSPFGITAGTSDVAVVNGAFSTVRPLGSDGEHTIDLVATDAAGNVTSRSVTVTIDRGLPAVQITTPVQGAFIPTAAPAVAVQWSDAKGINAESLQVLIDGEDKTARFTKGTDGATGTIDGLGDGPHQMLVRVRDRAGNLAEASAAFTVDTAPPDVAIEAARGRVLYGGRDRRRPGPRVRHDRRPRGRQRRRCRGRGWRLQRDRYSGRRSRQHDAPGGGDGRRGQYQRIVDPRQRRPRPAGRQHHGSGRRDVSQGAEPHGDRHGHRCFAAQRRGQRADRGRRRRHFQRADPRHGRRAHDSSDSHRRRGEQSRRRK